MTSLMTLPREEYIEQEYFFRVYRERLQENVPSQEILRTVHEEILSTTRLPMAVDFMRAEIMHSGRISDAMARLPHYFSAFQSFVVARAEDDVARFEQTIALEILEREARYRAEATTTAGLFVYQFECLSRNRLGYTDGLTAMSKDPVYDETWKKWILGLRQQLGASELSELVYRASQYFVTRRLKKQRLTSEKGDNAAPDVAKLFGEQEGRIARANIGRDPLFFFAALQRQLNYPQVPLSRVDEDETLPSFLEERLTKIEQRLKIVELEQKGGIDLSKFYKKEEGGSPDFSDLGEFE